MGTKPLDFFLHLPVPCLCFCFLGEAHVVVVVAVDASLTWSSLLLPHFFHWLRLSSKNQSQNPKSEMKSIKANQNQNNYWTKVNFNLVNIQKRMSDRERECGKSKNVQGAHGSSGGGVRRQSSGFDWRSRFFSVFVVNLSTRASVSVLWQAFDIYGKVVDVFVQSRSSKKVTYAFVRFKDQSKMLRAIQWGDGRKVDGFVISVREAIPVSKGGFGTVAQNREYGASRDDRSYREVVDERGYASSMGVNGGSSVPEVAKNHCTIGNSIPVLKFNVEDMGASLWLNRSALGRLKNFIQPKLIQDSLASHGVSVGVSPYGGLSVLITFGSREEMLRLVQNHLELFEEWMVSIVPWDHKMSQRGSVRWLVMERVPLHLWHPDFFKAVGNMLGSFIAMDESTCSRHRLDIARVLVETSKTVLPSTIIIECKGISYELEIHSIPVHESCIFPFDRKLSGGGSVEGEASTESSSSKALVGVGERSVSMEKVASSKNEPEAVFQKSINTSRLGKSICASDEARREVALNGRAQDLVNDPGSSSGPNCNWAGPKALVCLPLSSRGPESALNGSPQPIADDPPRICNSPFVNRTSFSKVEESPFEVSDGSCPSDGGTSRDLRITLGNRLSRREVKKRFKKRRRRATAEVHYGERSDQFFASISDSEIEYRNDVLRREAEETLAVGDRLEMDFANDRQSVVDKLASFKEGDAGRS